MATNDGVPVLGVDHLEFWVGNARQSAFYYMHGFGFAPLAYQGPETGARDHASYVLAQGTIRLVLSSGLTPESEIARHVLCHGDGVRNVALHVSDARAVFERAVAAGAVAVEEPRSLDGADGAYRRAAIKAYGDTVHALVERDGYRGVFAPGYVAWQPAGEGVTTGLTAIDHVVANVADGQMQKWVPFYEQTLGLGVLTSFDDRDISTEYSALRSVVVASADGGVKLPINEPAPGRKKSQIEEYLEFYRGAGVQHIALRSEDIVETVRAMGARGIEFLAAPEGYYAGLQKRIGPIDEDIADLQALGILVDRDDQGYMLQIFTRPVQDRPTLFYEVIERKGSQSFGKGNFKALFEAIEREQAERGNL